MCRSIKPLFNYDPPATDEEIRDASLQFVRKVSGFAKPSNLNEVEFERAIDNVSREVKDLLGSLVVNSKPKNREVEANKAKERSIKRFS